MFLAKTSFKMVLIVAALDTTKLIFMPNFSLLLWVCVLMVADFVTGLIKAKVLKEPITSERMRASIVKFLQYFGCIGLVMIMANQRGNTESVRQVLAWAHDGLTILILYIEALSVLENLYQMDGKTPFARHVLRPLYFILSMAVKNNPAKKTADECRDDDRTKEKKGTFNDKTTPP